ncbi:MAG: Tat pathway signal protein [Betaproteobacteria bacterium RIFCSPLOWO2_12_FULL_65_110]|nr:MAG: Tat pathway signal protein [Betaproteobacteria bacterium RIFCSPLOWO2_02_FULL_65_20]OGA41282.1 MAG: Tat pathway signal protein [Betaproteobacteria bacterium RIFCSPLOWO2_12_FULL_65_110]
MKPWTTLGPVLVSLVGALAAGLAYGQEAYPAARPITMVVAFPPGGVADLTARPTAISLEGILKQRVIVENKAGAGGGIGNAFVAKARPDGYTLLMALSSVTILPEADKVNDRPPTYELSQLMPIALISADPTFLVVRSESPYKSVKDLIAAARANPGKINYSSSGYYGALHTPMAMFTLAAGINLFHIPYQGGAPAVTALLGGQVEVLASGPGPVVPHIKAGKLRALATWGAKRHPVLPEVATLKELGVDAEFYIWAGLFAPAGTPDPIVRQLRDAVKLVVNDPQFKRSMDTAGQPIFYLDAPEFKQFVDKDARKMADVVKAIGKVEVKK